MTLTDRFTNGTAVYNLLSWGFLTEGLASTQDMFKMLKVEVKITLSCPKLASLQSKLHWGGSKNFSVILKH